jgi:TldD protein
VRLFCFGVALALAPVCLAGPASLLDILSDELNRNYKVLKEKGDPPACFMSYSVVDVDAHVISASFGALRADSRSQTRTLDVTVRVGSPKFDNYHVVRGDRPNFTSGTQIPIENKDTAIRQKLWTETDRVYRLGAERLINLKTKKDLNVAEEDPSDDFSSAPVIVDRQASRPHKVDADQWAQKARRWSAEFNQYSGVLAASVTVMIEDQTKYLVNSEGTQLEHGRGFARILITAQGKAPDGMDLATFDSFEAVNAADLPADQVVLASVRKVGSDLQALLNAPLVEPIVAPAILSGRASGVFFHEIFGHRIEGHRQKDDAEGQTFTKSVGSPVLPDFLSVVFDATRQKMAGIDLNGQYLYDDEGVRARPVTVVDHGVLKTFLLSRSPIRSFPESNGHGRRQAGAEVVSRQSNLIVESSRSVSEKQLRQMLIDEIKKQNKPYGFYFRDITGGFTTTTRSGPQAFKVIPLVVYRVYPDGRPDELVRGVDIVGTPLASFAKILATSDKPEVFNGYCGAESGNVPVSAVSPAILVSELEIEKKAQSQDGPPLLPVPPRSPERTTPRLGGAQ